MSKWYLILIYALLTGCATGPASLMHTGSEVIVPLQKVDNKLYRLVDQSGKTVARANGGDTFVNFKIPENTDLSQCFSVFSPSNSNIYGGASFLFPLTSEYRKVDQLKTRLDQNITGQRRKYERNKTLIANATSSLESNRAFKDRRCYLPKQRPLPPEPVTKCSSYEKCKEEGRAICFTRFVGAEGCSIAARKYGVSGMLAAPGCSATAARLAGEKYDLGDAFVDFLHGVADDIAENMREEGSEIMAGIVSGINYAVKINRAEGCANNFVQRYYGPKLRWNQLVRDIRSEPQKTRDKCVGLIRNHNDYVERNKELSGKLNNALLSASHVNALHRFLDSRKYHAPVCSSGIKTLRLVSDSSVKRYLIGASIEKVESGVRGVKLVKLLDDMPAKAAGMREGDIVTSIGGQAVDDTEAFTNYVQEFGQSVIEMDFVRDGTLFEVAFKPKLKVVEIKGL